MISADAMEDLLTALGDLLEARGLAYSVVTVGGGSLMLLKLSIRPTRDLDVVALLENDTYVKADPLPGPLIDAARDIGTAMGVGGNWLNAGPASLLDFGLPAGFRQRTVVRRYGSLTVQVASRFDQICFKLYAAVDQGPSSKHLDDLRLLEPTHAELLEAARWSTTHDPSEGYRTHLIALLKMLGITDADRHL
jgi:hypothetical protein